MAASCWLRWHSFLADLRPDIRSGKGQGPVVQPLRGGDLGGAPFAMSQRRLMSLTLATALRRVSTSEMLRRGA